MQNIGFENVVVMSSVKPNSRYPVLSMVEAYWTALRGNRRAPARSEIDPVGIEDALEYAFILERVAPGISRFRIAGSHLNDLMGMEVRGMPVTSLFEPSSRMHASQSIERVYRDATPLELRLFSPNKSETDRLDAQFLLLPLQSDFGDISRALGVLVSRGRIGQTPRRFDLADTAKLRSTIAELVETPSTPEFAEKAATFEHQKKPDAKRPALRLVWDENNPSD